MVNSITAKIEWDDSIMLNIDSVKRAMMIATNFCQRFKVTEIKEPPPSNPRIVTDLLKMRLDFKEIRIQKYLDHIKEIEQQNDELRKIKVWQIKAIVGNLERENKLLKATIAQFKMTADEYMTDLSGSKDSVSGEGSPEK